MISIHHIIFIFSLFGSQNCEPSELSIAVEEANIITSGRAGTRMNMQGTYYTEFFIDELFKSDFLIEYEYILIESKCSETCSICLTEGEQYILYGSKSTSKINSFKVSESFRTKKIDEAQADLTYLMKLPCEYGESTNRGCPRHLSQVCGCNGTTYGNACEASSAGITQWKDGKCR